MRYQLIDVRKTQNGEVAYLLDAQSGKVVKVKVHDISGDESDVLESLPGEDRSVEHTEHPAPPRGPLPDKPKSIVPPGMVAMMTPQGNPGEAIETRSTI